MGLGSIARLIPASIPEERRQGAPREGGWMLVLCWAGRDQAGLQRTKLRARRWQQPGPQPVWDPKLVPRAGWTAGGPLVFTPS